MNSADLFRVVVRFEIVRPQKLLLTKLDETEALGPMSNETARTGKPVSFLSAGQRIPEEPPRDPQGRIAVCGAVEVR